MIEKFNFYDIYGYLIPGLAVVGLLWVPFGLLLHKWPATDFGAAILTLVFAYILGHVIHITADGIVPPEIKDAFGNTRFPSDIVLDRKCLFSPELKTRIAERCWERFNIDISEGKDPENTPDKKQMESISRARREAFFRARSALVHAGNKGYAEQFEGLYAMMAGIVVGLGVAGCYFVGWATAFWECKRFANHLAWVIGIEIILLILAAIFAVQSLSNEMKMDRAKNSDERKRAHDAKKAKEKRFAIALAPVSLWAGVLIGCRALPSIQSTMLCYDFAWAMILITTGAVTVAVLLYGSYRGFAKDFAATVWRDFADMAESPSTPSAPNSPSATTAVPPSETSASS